jgi:hypothetical protein
MPDKTSGPSRSDAAPRRFRRAKIDLKLKLSALTTA